MHISEIQIENFRLFSEFSLPLSPGLNVIVGENNSGKTALIDAIRFTLDTNSSEWIRISENDFHTGSVSFSIRLKFENITVDQAYVFVEHLTHEEIEGGGRKSVLYVNLNANLTDNIRRGNRFIRTEVRSGENAEGPTIEREIREYLSATYLKPLRNAEAELSAGRSSLWLPKIPSGMIPRDSGDRDMISIDDRNYQNAVADSRLADQIA